MAEQEKMIQHLFDTGFTVPVDLTLDEAAATYLFCCSRPLIFAFYTDMKMISVVRIAEKESLTEGGDLIFLVEKNRNVLMGSWLSCKSPNSKGPVIICWSPVLVVLGDSPPVTLDHSLMLLLLPFISGNPIQVVSSSLSQ
ncbi:hypothetical protein EE612_035510, partial [Oryza sativa]